MKKKLFMLIPYFVSIVFCFGQTPLVYEQFLTEQYKKQITPVHSYAALNVFADQNKQFIYAFLCQTGNIEYDGNTYQTDGDAGILLEINASTGAHVWHSILGNKTVPLTAIESSVIDKNGNLCIIAHATFSGGSSIQLGNQSYSYNTTNLPSRVIATFSFSDHAWSNVHFIYAPNHQGLSLFPKVDTKGNFYLCGTVTSTNLFIDDKQIVSGDSNSGMQIFVYKENSQGQKVYNKQTQNVTNTQLYNLQFEIDNEENFYIGGSLAYISGSISLDGFIVKNDTLSNKYDYSYQDIFLYKLDASGSVKLARTYLYSGNESILYLKTLKNGSICMVAEYSGLVQNLPASSSLFYNRFVSNLSSSTGDFNWIKGLNCSIYYSNRYPYQNILDSEGNLYFMSKFFPSSVEFLGSRFVKRNNSYGASNTLCTKISPDGQLLWGKVLGPITTFTDVIDNPGVIFAEIGSNLMIQTKAMSYGSNRNFEWGSDSIAEVSMYGSMYGDMAVIDKNTGNVRFGYYQGFDSNIELKTLDYFLVRNNYMDWDIARYNMPDYSGLSELNSKNLQIIPDYLNKNISIKGLSPNSKINIISMDGKIVKTLTNANSSISVSDLKPSLYLLQSGEKTGRFLIK